MLLLIQNEQTAGRPRDDAFPAHTRTLLISAVSSGVGGSAPLSTWPPASPSRAMRTAMVCSSIDERAVFFFFFERF